MNDLEQRFAHLSPERRELLRRASLRERATKARIRSRPRPERVPLTFGQRRLWLLDQLFPQTTAYNSPIGIWLRGAIDATLVRQALQSLVDRHEVLRTVYLAHAGEPYQKILAEQELPWREASVTDAHADARSRREAALAIAREETRKPFVLSSQPPIRAVLVRVGDERDDDLHLLALVFHHIAIDGWSIFTLRREFVEAYNALRAGGAPAPAPSPELQIADIALWQQDTFAGEGLRTQLEYWKGRLAGAPAALDLPTDRPRPAAQTFHGNVLTTEVPAALYARVQALARERQVTLSVVFLAAFQTLLSRYSGQERVVVAMGAAGRSRLELEPVVGFFVNMLPMHADLSADPRFDELLTEVREQVLLATENADAPLDRMLEELRLPRSVSYTPFAQAMYFFQSYPAQIPQIDGVRSEDAHWSELRAPTAQGDLSLMVNQHHERELIFEYSTDLFDESTIRRMSGHLLALLEAATAAPQTRISALPLLTAEERAQQTRWNDTRRELPADPTIAAQIAAQVARTPDAVAVSFGTRAMRYRELDARADALARELRQRGVGPGVLVGLYVERSLEMLIGLLGILKAGGAYVPLDPSYPAERLAYMLEMSGSTVVATQSSLCDALPFAGVAPVAIDADAVLSEPVSAPMTGAGPEDPAYVIFTSGSTGKPKGVEIRNRSAVNLLRSIAREPGMGSTDTICAISTLSFDIALTELVLPLTVGARILLVDRDTVRDGLRLRRLVDDEAITILQATPATWRMLLDVGWRGKPGLKMISTGEALPRELAARLHGLGRELWNLYGPTETTVYSALCRVEAGDGPILVGRPVDNTQLHIVDRGMQLRPVGIPGELLIGGAGLAAGYRGRPDLTAEKFIADPFSADSDARLYRTGDLACWREDGSVQVLGRIDHQIKLRGFRIELGEIETVLARYPGITQAVAHCREDRAGDPRLVAYYTSEGAAPEASALREHLKAALPEYMIPSAFVGLREFPLTPNGKVDRKALPAPEAAGDETGYVAPRTEEEAALATLWSELLGMPRIDARANFFDLGGHSLLASQMLARIEHDYGIALPLRVLFEAPTLTQLASRVAAECEIVDQDVLETMLRDFEHLSDEEIRRRLGDD